MTVHFIGIGGAGMSGIARIMLARGETVSGSDAKSGREVTALRALGASVHIGHDATYVANADTVVVSSAIPMNNVERLEAQRRGLPVLPRAEALAEVMRGRRGVAVAGTHGKTTTTSMLTVAAQHCGVDPSFAIGGSLAESGVNAHDGTGDLFIAEADESDGSFLALEPLVGVVTNVEPDHLDHYADAAAVDEAFQAFVSRTRPGGFVVICLDDPGSARLAAYAKGAGFDVRSYGESPEADLRLDELALTANRSTAAVVHHGRRLGLLTLRLPGRHNLLNAAAAVSAGLGLRLPWVDLRDGLAEFAGTRRRFEPKGAGGGVRVFDDYAHHPTEIRATLTAARQVAGTGRLVVAFQPHRYSRTAAFRQEFGQALALADDVVVLEVYPAGEAPVPGASGASVAAAVPLPANRVLFESSWSAVAARLVERARPGDLILTLGAGDITMIGPEVVSLLRRAATA